MGSLFATWSVPDYIFLICGVLGSFFFALRAVALFFGIVGVSNVDAIEAGSNADSAGSLLEDLNGNGIPDALEADVSSVEVASPSDLIQDNNGNGILDVIEANEIQVKVGRKFIEFSVQNTCAFLMMFGWVGLAMTRYSGLNPILAILGGFAVGTFAAWLFTKLNQALMSLSRSGNKVMSSAIGSKGKVYLTILPNDMGQIQVEVSGRLDTCKAISEDNTEIPFGTEVMVVRVKEDNILVVKRID